MIQNTEMNDRVIQLDHPLVHHHMGIIREQTTSACQFRHSARQLTQLLAIRATADLAVEEVTVTTPLETCAARRIAGRVGLVPILRAGIVMVEPLLELIPEAEVWHLGVYRNEQDARPVSYYNKLAGGKPVDTAIVLDPMLATGGSAVMTCNNLQRWGVGQIRMLSVIAAPEGIANLTAACPDLTVYTCMIDRGLNELNYIVPGLGDAGDRVFNTL